MLCCNSNWINNSDGETVHTPSQEVYGTLGNGRFENAMKMGGIGILNGSLALPFLKMVSRALGILTGDWVTAGKAFGQREWNLKKQAWSLSQSSAPCPDNKAYVICVVKHSLIQLGKNVAKCVTLPLAGIATFFSALYGLLINLNVGRRMMGKIEFTWTRDNMLTPEKYDTGSISLSEIFAPCMQPEYVFDLYIRSHIIIPKKNLAVSKINDCMVRLHFNREFFHREGVEAEELTFCLVDALNRRINQHKFIKQKPEEKRVYLTEMIEASNQLIIDQIDGIMSILDTIEKRRWEACTPETRCGPLAVVDLNDALVQSVDKIEASVTEMRASLRQLKT